MNRTLRFEYFLIGFVVGWVFAQGFARGSDLSYWALLAALGGILIFAALLWLDSFGQRHRRENWPALRAKGKWSFVFIYHVLIRGVVLVLFLCLMPFVSVGFTSPILVALGIGALCLLAVLVYLGLDEWHANELTFLGVASETTSGRAG